MATYNYVCRAQYKAVVNSTEHDRSAIYLFKTENFTRAEQLALNKVKTRSDYTKSGWVSSIKRKTPFAFENTETASRSELYRVTMKNVKEISSGKVITLSFIFWYEPDATASALETFVWTLTNASGSLITNFYQEITAEAWAADLLRAEAARLYKGATGVTTYKFTKELVKHQGEESE